MPDDPVRDDLVATGPVHGFVKARAAPPGFFEYEAAGLRWLAGARDVGGPPVAEVLAVAPGRIVLRRLATVAPTAAAAKQLGRELAVLHAAEAAGFGALPDGWDGPAFIGRQRLPVGTGAPQTAWGRFYAELRLAPFARSAHEVGNLSARGLGAVERVCERLVAGDHDDGRPAARVHGDLWAGNVVFAASGATLIDPSAHGGHGEGDLAMLALFGLAHLGRVEAAYAEAAALPGDWRDRAGLHQLYPLLVHATSHGPSYGIEAERVALRYA